MLTCVCAVALACVRVQERVSAIDAWRPLRSSALCLRHAGTASSVTVSYKIGRPNVFRKIIAAYRDYASVSSDGRRTHFIVLAVSDTQTAEMLRKALPGMWPSLHSEAAAEDAESDSIKPCFFCDSDFVTLTAPRDRNKDCSRHKPDAMLVRDPATLSRGATTSTGVDESKLPGPDEEINPVQLAQTSPPKPLIFRKSLVWSCCGAPYLRTGVGSNGCVRAPHLTIEEVVRLRKPQAE